MQRRLLTVEFETYSDDDRWLDLSSRTVSVIKRGGALIEEHFGSACCGSEIILMIVADAKTARRVWSNIEASGLENEWEAFGAKLRFQEFAMTS